MKKAKIYSNDFNRIIAATKDFVDQNADKSPMSYIKLEFISKFQTVTAVAIDGKRISVEHSVISDCDEDFVVYVRNNIKLPKNRFATIDLQDDEVKILCDECIFGNKQPDGKFYEWEKALPKTKYNFKIAVNGNYLMSALKAAQISTGNSFKNPVVLEFRGEEEAIILRTNENDIKLVMPVRLKNKEK